MPVCYIIGAMPSDYIPDIRKGDILIAADGGYENLHGLRPDLVVGDFDSLGFVPPDEEIIKHPVRKDDTDTMLAVKLGLQRGFDTFVISGGYGGRFDHTFANIQTLAYIASAGGRGYLIMDDQWLTVVRDKIHFPEGLHGNISVFALGGNAEGVYISGLDYSLENGCLTPDFPLGVSNAFIGTEAEVSVQKGNLLIVCAGMPSQGLIRM